MLVIKKKNLFSSLDGEKKKILYKGMMIKMNCPFPNFTSLPNVPWSGVRNISYHVLHFACSKDSISSLYGKGKKTLYSKLGY